MKIIKSVIILLVAIPAMAVYGSLVQTVRTPACHAGGRRFETGTSRHWV